MMGEAPWGWSGPDHLTPFGTQGEEEGETKKRKTRETVDERCQMLCVGGSFLRVVSLH